jgi:hypothetical protein
MPREAVLCAWGLTEDGRKVLLHLAPGTKEDTASCTAFFEDLKRRGLPDPLLAITDGEIGAPLLRRRDNRLPRLALAHVDLRGGEVTGRPCKSLLGHAASVTAQSEWIIAAGRFIHCRTVIADSGHVSASSSSDSRPGWTGQRRLISRVMVRLG